MKREIKFRGKKIDGKWIYGSLAYIEDKPAIIYGRLDWVDGTELRGDDWDWVNPDTVCQYTGLKDRKGKDVYENDIIEAEIYDNEYDIFWVRFLIVWDKRRLRLKCLDEGDIDELEYLDESEATIKVLGNKWDNPELLEDGE